MRRLRQHWSRKAAQMSFSLCPFPYIALPRAQTIGVWGDIGHTPNSTDTRNHLLANNPAIVYNTADFVYAGAPLHCLCNVSIDPAAAILPDQDVTRHQHISMWVSVLCRSRMTASASTKSRRHLTPALLLACRQPPAHLHAQRRRRQLYGLRKRKCAAFVVSGTRGTW